MAQNVVRRLIQDIRQPNSDGYYTVMLDEIYLRSTICQERIVMLEFFTFTKINVRRLTLVADELNWTLQCQALHISHGIKH